MIRGIVTAVIEGAIKLFSSSGRSGETFSKREYFQHYGYTSRPKPGAEIIIIREGNHFIAVASDDRRYRIALEEGEVAIYDDLGQYVHLKRNSIEVSSPTKIKATAPNVEIIASTKVTMTTPLLEVSGAITAGSNITAAGNITDSVRSIAGDRAIYNGHGHTGVNVAPSQQQ